MVGDPIGDYLPTLIRFLLLAVAVVGISVGVHYLLRNVFHLKREVAIGYSLITPWILGFLVFNLIPMVSTVALSLFRIEHWKGVAVISEYGYRR